MRELAMFVMGIATVCIVCILGYANWLYLKRKQQAYGGEQKVDNNYASPTYAQQSLVLKAGDTIRVNELPDGTLALTRVDG